MGSQVLSICLEYLRLTNQNRAVHWKMYVQPFCKIALGRDVWNVVDIAVAELLLLTLWAEKSKTE